MEGIGKAGDSVPVDEAARELGTTPTKILTMLRSNELAGTSTGDGWMVTRRSVSCAKARGLYRAPSRGCAAGCGSKCGGG